MIGVGSLLGLGSSGMSSKNRDAVPAGGTAMAVPRPAAPVVPESALTTDGGRTANPQMEAERERERQTAALRKQQAPEIFTSGLGASGLADTAKKSLLGG